MSQEHMEALWFRMGNPPYPKEEEDQAPYSVMPTDEGEVLRAIEDLEDYGNPFAQYGPLFRGLLTMAKGDRLNAFEDVLTLMDRFDAMGNGNHWKDLRASIEELL